MKPSCHLPTLPWRLGAVVWLCVWLVGQVLCVHHCGSRILGTQSAQGCCAKKASAPTPATPEAPAPAASWACSESKVLKSEPSLSGWSNPSVTWALLPPVGLPVLPSIGVSGAALSAEASPPGGRLPRVEGVLQPEASRGAACRSLAPPQTAQA